MKTLGMLVLSTVFGSAVLSAEEAQPVAPYELKNKSSFGVEATARTPFWPIGWKKGAPVAMAKAAAPVEKAFQIEPSHFVVTSVLLSHPPLATINGRAFGEGEGLPVVVGNKPINVVVKAIRDGGVWLDQSGHQIFVPLKREKFIPNSVSEAKPAQAFEIKIDADQKGAKKAP